MGHSHIFLAEAGRPQRDDESQWEYIVSTTVPTLWTLPADWIAKALAYSTIRPLEDGHAYSLKELRELRSILRMRGDQQSDIGKLRSESDKFAYLVGWDVQRERRLSGEDRRRDIRKRFFKPADALLKALSDREFVKEFSAPWGGLKDLDHAKFKQDLQMAVAATNRHLAAIKALMGRGKAWDYHLKRLHVYMTDCFCKYFDHSFEVSRLNSSVKEERHAFQEAVELLAKPLFESGGRGSGFTAAIREHVDGGNAAKNELFKKMLGLVAK